MTEKWSDHFFSSFHHYQSITDCRPLCVHRPFEVRPWSATADAAAEAVPKWTTLSASATAPERTGLCIPPFSRETPEGAARLPRG